MVDYRTQDVLRTAGLISGVASQLGANRRSEERLGLEREEQGWKREDRVKTQKNETDKKLYFDLISQGKSPESLPEHQGKINPDALKSAYADYSMIKLSDTNFRKARNEAFAADADYAQMNIAKNMDSIAILMKEGRVDQANALMAETYNNFFPNGFQIEYDSVTKKFYEKVTDSSGNYTRGDQIPVEDVAKFMELGRSLIKDNKFKETYVGQRWSEEAANYAAFLDAEEVVDSKGNFVGRMAKFTKNGKADWQFSSKNDNKRVPWPNVRDQGLMVRSEWEHKQKFAADIAETRAKTKAHTEKDKTGGIEPKSPEGKEAIDLMRFMPERFRNSDEAMAYVQKKGILNSMAAAQKMADDIGMTDEEKAKFLNEVGPLLPGIPNKMPHKGLPGEEIRRSKETKSTGGMPSKTAKPSGPSPQQIDKMKKEFLQLRKTMSKPNAMKEMHKRYPDFNFDQR